MMRLCPISDTQRILIKFGRRGSEANYMYMQFFQVSAVLLTAAVGLLISSYSEAHL